MTNAVPQREKERSRRVVYKQTQNRRERVKEIQNLQTNINKNIKQNKPEYLRNGRESKQTSRPITDPSRRREASVLTATDGQCCQQ